MPKVSVVVPVYNVERYLALCLDSLRAQTLDDIEVICVDDGSTDRSPKILELFALVDERIKVITIGNEGVSVARNTGIEAATGEVICFVDADDAAKPGMCQRLYDTITTTGADVVKFSGEVFPVNNATPWLSKTLTLEDETFEGFSEELIFEKPSRPFPWNGGYRASFLREKNIRFKAGLPLGEDQVFSFATLGRSSKTVFISDVLYEYRRTRTDSAMAIIEEHLTRRMLLHMDVVEAIIDDWREGGLFDHCPKRLLAFVCDFLLEDICNLESAAKRDKVLTELSSRLAKWYTSTELDELASPKLRALLARIVSYDGDPAFMGKSRVYDVIEAVHGKKAALRRRVTDPIWVCRQVLRKVLRKVLPMPAANIVAYMELDRVLLEDNQAALRSIELLRLEAASKQGRA